jgi:histidinol dehydrogenase
VIRIPRKAAAKLGKLAAELARGEGLTAHAMSAEYRMKQIKS